MLSRLSFQRWFTPGFSYLSRFSNSASVNSSSVSLPNRNFSSSAFMRGFLIGLSGTPKQPASESDVSEQQLGIGTNEAFLAGASLLLSYKNHPTRISSAVYLQRLVKQTRLVSSALPYYAAENTRGKLLELLSYIPDDHLRRLVVSSPHFNLIENEMKDDAVIDAFRNKLDNKKLDKNLLEKNGVTINPLGEDFIVGLFKSASDLVNCNQLSILDYFDQVGIRRLANSYDALCICLAWASQGSGAHFEKLVNLLGVEYIKTKLKSEFQLANLLVSEITYGTPLKKNKIHSELFLKLMTPVLSNEEALENQSASIRGMSFRVSND